GLERRERMASHGNDPRLVALAGDAHCRIVEIDTVQREAGELGEAQSGRIKELEDRLVAKRKRIRLAKLHEARSLVWRQRMRQLPGRLRGANAEHRVAGKSMVAHEKLEEPAPSREHACKRAPAEPLAVQLGDKAPDLVHFEAVERNIPRQLDQCSDVAPVAGDGVSAEPSLVGEVIPVASQQGVASMLRRLGGGVGAPLQIAKVCKEEKYHQYRTAARLSC